MDLKKELWDKLTQLEEKKQGKADTYYDILALFNVVRSVFTIHSTEDEGVIKIVGTEEEAQKEVDTFNNQHIYADFFYEKQNIS